MNSQPAALLEDLIDACVMESYFREHMAGRDLIFHDTVAPRLAAYAPEATAAQQHDYLTRLHQTLSADDLEPPGCQPDGSRQFNQIVKERFADDILVRSAGAARDAEPAECFTGSD